MALKPSVMFGKVMHRRLFPKANGFLYSMYYLAFPLSKLNHLPLAVDRFAALSFHNRDHAERDGGDIECWARNILHDQNIVEADGDIIILTLPRVLGYVFNPVSFWFCLDKCDNIRAVICEVNNTFGETHTYIAVHGDRRAIDKHDVLEGEKVFHVSPFMPREGHYSFRFKLEQEACGVWINYHDKTGAKQLTTALVGTLVPMTKQVLRKAFWGYPLITFRAMLLIHWQALKLVFKRCKYFAKPKQTKPNITAARNIAKM